MEIIYLRDMIETDYIDSKWYEIRKRLYDPDDGYITGDGYGYGSDDSHGQGQGNDEGTGYGYGGNKCYQTNIYLEPTYGN